MASTAIVKSMIVRAPRESRSRGTPLRRPLSETTVTLVNVSTGTQSSTLVHPWMECSSLEAARVAKNLVDEMSGGVYARLRVEGKP